MIPVYFDASLNNTIIVIIGWLSLIIIALYITVTPAQLLANFAEYLYEEYAFVHGYRQWHILYII